VLKWRTQTNHLDDTQDKSTVGKQHTLQLISGMQCLILPSAMGGLTRHWQAAEIEKKEGGK
jgi:hypothetical protein